MYNAIYSRVCPGIEHDWWCNFVDQNKYKGCEYSKYLFEEFGCEIKAATVNGVVYTHFVFPSDIELTLCLLIYG